MKEIHNWQLAVSRKGDLQKVFSFSYGIGPYTKTVTSIEGVQHQLYYFDGRTTKIYFDADDYRRMLGEFAAKIKDIGFVTSFAGNLISACKESLKKAKESSASVADNITNAALYDVLMRFDRMWAQDFYPYGWFPFYLTPPLEDSVFEYIRSMSKTESETMDLLAIISEPSELTPIQRSEIDTYQLAKMMRERNRHIQEFAEEMAEQYGWMPVYNVDDKEREPGFYINEARKITDSGIDIDGTLHEMAEKSATNHRRYDAFVTAVRDPLARAQIELLHASGYLRDMREETRDRMTILERPVYESIARHTESSLAQVINLTNDEIKMLLFEPERRGDLKELASARIKRYLARLDGEIYTVIDEPSEIEDVLKEILNLTQTAELRGQSAVKGSSVVGAVRIVLNGRELGKVKRGDILVTGMTKPDYVQAMKKAVAVVTDEGGITCHAAIVAREMEKPCIVGTKIATQVLKDGDIVEVNANDGLVKIIKRANEK